MTEKADIPDPIDMGGWKGLTIEECGEPLVSLWGIHPKIQTLPIYFHKGINGANVEMYCRQGVADRLIKAATSLPRKYRLIIFDAFRPLLVQSNLFDSFEQQLKDQHPKKPVDEILALAQTYVSLPSADLAKPSPHATGGAVDLSIVDSTGNLLDMGAEFDSFEITAQTAYFKNRPGFELVHNNRLLLYEVMTDAGFSNYPEEWWHFDHGNQFWSRITGQTAIYGLAQLMEIKRVLIASPLIISYNHQAKPIVN